jgi:hypothetical protein
MDGELDGFLGSGLGGAGAHLAYKALNTPQKKKKRKKIMQM